jgi:hypothetical protein
MGTRTKPGKEQDQSSPLSAEYNRANTAINNDAVNKGVAEGIE